MAQDFAVMNPVVPVLEGKRRIFLSVLNVNTNPYSRYFRLIQVMKMRTKIILILRNTPEKLNVLSRSGR